MRYRKLGSSDLEVSEISLGSWLTYAGGIEAEQTRACTEAAFEAGINFFDTANLYGRGAAEAAWGEILSRRPRALNLALRPYAIDYPRWRVLAVLNEHSGATMGEVAELTSVDRTTLTHTLKLMEREGLISGSWQVSPRMGMGASGQEASTRPLYTPEQRARARAGDLTGLRLPRTLRTFAHLAGRYMGPPIRERHYTVCSLPLVVDVAEAARTSRLLARRRHARAA